VTTDTAPENPLAARRLPRLALACAALVVLYSVLILGGWAVNRLWIAQLQAEYLPMAPSSALCFILLGAALLLRLRRPGSPGARRTWQALVCIVLLFTIAILLQFELVYGTNSLIDIEQWLGPAARSAQGELVGRMSPLTALLFVLLACAALVSRPNCAGGQAGASRPHRALPWLPS
jgi:hypothetical protein